MFHIGIAVQHPPLPDSSQLSELGIDFIKQCLTIDPDERPTAVQLMSHPWIEQFKEDLEDAFEEETGSNSSNGVGSHSLGWNSNATTASSISGPVLEEDEEVEEEGYNAGKANELLEEREEEEGGYNGGAGLENTLSDEKEEEEECQRYE